MFDSPLIGKLVTSKGLDTSNSSTQQQLTRLLQWQALLFWAALFESITRITGRLEALEVVAAAEEAVVEVVVEDVRALVAVVGAEEAEVVAVAEDAAADEAVADLPSSPGTMEPLPPLRERRSPLIK